MAFLTRALLWASFLIAFAKSIPTIHSKGAKLFDSTGKQFYIKGIAYQLVPGDPLLDVDQCSRDAALMQTLGTNSIRVYHVDPSQSHDDCMTVFANAGIYLWLDLDTFTTQMDQDSITWSASQFSNFAAVMDAFAKYDNLAGFWVGNEVIRTAAGSLAATYVKAATTDLKAYRAAKSYRNFLIGYSAADIAELRPMLQNYLACGDPATAIEAFGLNSYEWCGTGANFNTSGYSNLQAQAANYNIPIFFSETGCNVGTERTFDDQASILGPDMDGTWSGAIIYEWIQEANHYGLISYPGGGVSGEPTPVQPDFNNLQKQWSGLNPSGIKESDYAPSIVAPACPGSSNGWLVNGNPPLPTLGVAAVTSVTFSNTIRPSLTSMNPSTPSPQTTSMSSFLILTASNSGATSTSNPESTQSTPIEGVKPQSGTTPPLTSSQTSTAASPAATTSKSAAAAGWRGDGMGMVAGVVVAGVLVGI